MKSKQICPQTEQAGFTLIELVIAMALTLALMAAACLLISSSFRIRARENERVVGLMNTRRALQNMVREISNTGFNMQGNGIVAGDSDATSLRFRADLNAFEGAATSRLIADANEDVKYSANTDPATGRIYLMRRDVFTGDQQLLAGPVDAFRIRYFDSRVAYTTQGCDVQVAPGTAEVSPDAASFIVVSICQRLPAVGTPGSPGYQPATQVFASAEAVLRNANISTY